MPSHSLRDRILNTLATWVYQLAWPIVWVGFLLAVGSILIALKGVPFLEVKKLAISGNPNDLLRSDASYHKNYLDYIGEFQAEEDYVVVVHGKDFETNKACVEFIAKGLSEKPELFKNVFYRVDLGVLAKERGLLFLDLSQVKEIEKQIGEFAGLLGKDQFSLDLNSLLSMASTKFDPKYMRRAENEKSLDSFAGEFVTSLTALADRLEGKVSPGEKVSFGNFMAENSDLVKLKKEAALHEYIAFEEGRILLMQIPSPNVEASFGDHEYVIRPLNEVLESARQKYPDLEIGLTGEPALSEDQAVATTGDSTRASILTFVLIAILFWFGYKEATRPFLALLTLVLAVCWTIGFTTLAIGRLNILSLAFLPMILGLGIDFGIQILGRYEEELPQGNDVVGALAQTMMHTGNAILTGASTTAAAFYTMCLNDFTGLAEMGLIGGTGILLCLVGNLVLLPAMLSLRDRTRGKQAALPSMEKPVKQNFIDRSVLEYPWVILGVALVLTVAACTQIKQVWFDYNLLSLQNADLESVKFEQLLLKSEDSRSIIFAADVCDNLTQAASRVDRYRKLASVHDAVSLTKIVPTDQEAKLKVVSQIKSRLESVKVPKSGVNVNVPENIRVLKALKLNCEKMNKLAQKWAVKEQRVEAAEFFGKLISAMDRCLKVLGSMSQKEAEIILTAYQTQVFGELRKNLEELKGQKVDRPIAETDIPESIRKKFVGKTGRILIQVYPKYNIWDREPLVQFVRELRTVNPKVTGTPVQNYEYVEMLKVKYLEAGRNALIVIFILIVLHFFWTPKYIFPTVIPLALGIVWTLGLMPVLQLPFNPANIVSVPLILGIGVAFGVYAVDRYRENRSPALFSTSTGKAILLSAFTTLFGFGSLILASDPSLRSIGMLMSIGVFMCMITSLYVCPAILQVLGRRKMDV